MTPPRIAMAELLDRYEVFFLDAYGVLVTTSGSLPGAPEFLQAIERRGKRCAVLSNDASRTPATIVERYRRFGVPVAPTNLFTSGMLLERHFAANGLAGARTVVLGTEDSATFVAAAGGHVVPFDDPDFEVVVVADDDGYPFLPAIEIVLTHLFRALDAGRRPVLLLPNPDLIYPKAAGEYGLASGMVALAFEQALAVRFPGAGLVFERLGKPERALFDWALEALAIADRRSVVMLGDQLPTDILGATRAGIDSVLVGTGLTALASALGQPWPFPPTFVLPSLV